MKYDFVEIGTSDFDTLLQSTDSKIGISVEPLKIYLDKLPDKKNITKLNCAISDKDDIVDIFWIEPEDIIKYNLPDWLRGCNSIINPHPSAIKELENRNLLNIYKKSKTQCLCWKTFIKNFNIKYIDYLKIDTEGHDHIIINDILNSNIVLPKKILFENNLLYDRNSVFEILEKLKNRGYVIISEENLNILVERKITIDKVIFAKDDNPKYDGLWEIVSEICYKKLNITPILFHITDQESDFFHDKYGIIKKIKKIENIPTGFQCQIYRMFGTKYFQEEFCLISDIDMLMLNKKYFFDPLDRVCVDDLIIYSSDAYDSNRPECVGIYSGSRYPMCYVLAKGKTFIKLLESDCDFSEYCNKVLKMGYPTHDSDELYFGHCVDNKQHGINVHKLKRGYSSKFICDKRNERVNDDSFNLYDKIKLKNDEYVDFHLARPYKRYKTEIDEVLNISLNNKKEIYLVACHIENQTQEKLLRELIQILINNCKKFVLISHTLIPVDLIEKSEAFIYDKVNPIYKPWELENRFKFSYITDFFTLLSPYISYGSCDYYHVGALRLLIQGIKYLQNQGYDVVHWIEYDSLPEFQMDYDAKNLLDDYDFIFYGVGARFTFNPNKVNTEFLNSNDDQLFKLLKINNWVAEQVISKNLVTDKKHTIFLNESNKDLWGRYSQPFSQKFDWSIFDHSNVINLFIANYHTEKIKVEFSINKNKESSVFYVDKNCWSCVPLANSLQNFKLIVDEKLIIDIDLMINDNYYKLINTVEFHPK